MSSVSSPYLPDTFKNPILSPGQDPSVVYYEGTYYLIQSEHGTMITIYQNAQLSRIAEGQKKVVWCAPPTGANSCSIWAPELFPFQGRWYIHYAADDGENSNHRMYVLESDDSDPMGPYHEKGKITDPSNKWAIDGTVLQFRGELYFIWSGWPGDVNVQQNLYIAPMSNPWTISGPRQLLSEPTYDWEIPLSGPSINEGPAVLIRNDNIFLVYSANGSWTDDYCLGMLTNRGQDPLDPASWSKAQTPVFTKKPEASIYGPGHNCFVKSPDGTEDWLVYHANLVAGTGWYGRSIRMQKVAWVNDVPVFGEPIPLEVTLPTPSGERA